MTTLTKRCPNPNALQVHTDSRMERCCTEFGHGRAKWPAWAARIMDVDGVDHLTCLHDYEMLIIKAELFSWDDIIPKVETILREELN